MSAKPSFKMPDRRIDEWVGRGEATPVTQPTPPSPAPEPVPAAVQPLAPEPEKQKVRQARLTIDLDAPMHARFKATCALRGTNMVDEVRTFIERWIETKSV